MDSNFRVDPKYHLEKDRYLHDGWSWRLLLDYIRPYVDLDNRVYAKYARYMIKDAPAAGFYQFALVGKLWLLENGGE